MNLHWEIKIQRDKAKIEHENLIIEIKQTKHEWASLRKTQMKIIKLKKKLINTVETLQKIRRSIYPKH